MATKKTAIVPSGNIITAHLKFIAAVVGAVIAFAQLVIYSPAAHISASEWVTGAILLATALGVYSTPNKS